MPNHILALDIGTSVIKGSVFSADGSVLAQASESVESNGAGFVNPMTVWEKSARVIAEVRAKLLGSAEIDAIIATGQGDGLWMLEGGTQVPERAYLWNSTAGADVIQDFEKAGVIQSQFDATGTVLWSGASVALWNWYRAEFPEAASRTTTVFNAKDFINFKLTGRIATDLTDATIPFADPITGGYSDEAFRRLDAEDLRALVAEILPAGELVGTLTTEAASLTGLSPQTPVFMGVLDVVAMVLGSGMEKPGEVLSILGTTAASISVVPRGHVGKNASGATLFLDGGNLSLRVMGSSSGTATLDWFMRSHGFDGPEKFTELWDEISNSKQGDEVFLPFLNGERAPFLAPKATGSLLGLTTETSRGSIARAVVEGITMSLNHGIQVAAEESDVRDLVHITLCGGGSSSSEWAQLVANVTGASVQVDNRPDLGAIGVASIISPSIAKKADKSDSSDQLYLPNENREIMKKKYAQYLKYVNLFRGQWDQDSKL